MGRFALRICHSNRGSDIAFVEIINRIEGAEPTRTGIDVHLPADHLAVVYETKDEKKWNTQYMESRRKYARSR